MIRIVICRPETPSLIMNINSLPCEIITQCFSYLNTEVLSNIVLLDNISDNIVQAAANNLNLWYSKRIRGVGRNTCIENHYETGFDRAYDGIAFDRYHTETDFDRFLRIHKVLEEKAHKCPLWFHCRWENVFQMHQNLDQINLAHKGQKLGIYADLKDPAFQIYPIFSDHEINLKITCLSLKASYPLIEFCINLNNFPNLETFYGDHCEIVVDHSHPSLMFMYLNQVTFSSLPTNLIKLVTTECLIKMNENHPKLEALTVLVIEYTLQPVDCYSLLRVLWNKDLETFLYFDEGDTNVDEIISMIGPKVLDFGFSGALFSKIPTLLRSLHSDDSSNFYEDVRIGLHDLSAFTHMTSLRMNKPPPFTHRLKLPPNLLRLSLRWARYWGEVEFPATIVDLELKICAITLTAGWLKPARLKRLSLEGNNLSSFKAVLPCCEYLCLNDNIIKEVQIEAPLLQHIDLAKNLLTSIPKLPARVQVLLLSENKLDLSQMSELPSDVKHLDLQRAGTGALQNYTFQTSVQELHFTGLDLSRMSGVKFAKGSKLRELNMDNCHLKIVNDRMIELPRGLESLNLLGNKLKNIHKLTIPPTVTSVNLGSNSLRSLKVKSHIETLDLRRNSTLLGLTIPKDLELKVLDFRGVEFGELLLDLAEADKLTQLRLGVEFEEIELLKVKKKKKNFRVLEVSEGCVIKGLHRYLNLRIYRPPPEYS